MAEKSLAVKYRPTSFDDLTEQEYIKVILENQIKNNDIKNAYLFVGSAGCGKTTTARIFANKINEGIGNPIEIDAASNNGVEQIRTIIEDAKFKPIVGKYKVYILDECHMLSIGAWNALLKLLEEPPKTTVFILCTTDPQKIPKTILSRVQRFDFKKISLDGIKNRLIYICKEENIIIENEAIDYIAKIADGGMREAISMLDKCSSFENNLSTSTVIDILGICDYDCLVALLKAIISQNESKSIAIIEKLYQDGKDLKLFMKQFIDFILDVCKYNIFNNYKYTQIPSTVNLQDLGDYRYSYLLVILNEIMSLYNSIKYEQSPKGLIESNLLLLCRKDLLYAE